MAIAGLIVGAIEALAVATVVYGFGTALTADDSTNASAYQGYSLPATPLDTPPTKIIVPSLTTPPPIETTVDVPEDASVLLPVVDDAGDAGDPSVDNHATSSDGTFMKCAYAGRSAARWVQSAPISPMPTAVRPAIRQRGV